VISYAHDLASFVSDFGGLLFQGDFYFQVNNLGGVIPDEVCGLFDHNLENFGALPGTDCGEEGLYSNELTCPFQGCCPRCFKR